MIGTSSYNNWQSDKYITYSISGNRGKDANYQGRCYPKLAPKLSFWKTWHDNIGKISEEENNRYYVQEYWNQVLSRLDPEQVYRELDDSILLCYESNTEFCHRHIVAAWFEILLGINVPETRANDYAIEEIERPTYIKQYLEEAMRYNRNMRGFNSLRALYLFEKGEKLETLASELEEKSDKCYDVIAYSSNRNIEYTPEPTQPIKSFAEVHTDENQKIATKSVLALMDDMESESKDNETPTKEKDVKKLSRIFKRNKNKK